MPKTEKCLQCPETETILQCFSFFLILKIGKNHKAYLKEKQSIQE